MVLPPVASAQPKRAGLEVLAFETVPWAEYVTLRAV